MEGHPPYQKAGITRYERGECLPIFTFPRATKSRRKAGGAPHLRW